MKPKFVHLRVHTEYSLVDSVVRIKKLVAKAAESMPALAITDESNMFAVIKFYRACMAAGIKPVIGTDAWIGNPDAVEPLSRAVLLSQNMAGYRNLARLVSRSYQEGQHDGRAIIQRDWLFAESEGVIVLSGGVQGEPGQALLAGKPEEAERLIREWQEVFGDRYYLELQRTDRKGELVVNNGSLLLADQLGVPVVATNDVRLLEAGDFESHEARVCIHERRVLADPNRPRPYSDRQYVRSAEEMCELFSDVPEALENTVEIAKRCNLTMTLGKSVLPDFPIPEGMTEEEFFAKECWDGLEMRLDQLYDRNAADFAEIRKPYDERLQTELNVITQMKFPGYFLIVADFIQWAKNNDIPVGPGRGSGAGSLVAYALKITDLDPLKYDLLFERFLNPERISMPDFDVDFCMDGRDRVIQYVSHTYGEEKVSQIITYGTMAAKAVVRDVGRVMGHPFGFVDRVAKMVPMDLGITLEKAMAEDGDLKQAYNDDEEVRTLIDMAMSLEGLARNAGKHAGGVVIAPSGLTDFAPLYCEEDGSSLVTQFDKDDAEAVGLVKFDFLGLRTLTILDNAVRTIDRIHGGKLDLMAVPLDDHPTYELLKSANTTAVFQLESRGMKNLIERLLPDCFEDIVALVALFRPGPLQSGMVDDFIERKHGKQELAWPHPDYQLESLKPVLESTYGIILYQEQVMQIAQVMAGYTLGGADMLRRAMGKKKPEEMAKQRATFLEGAASQGIDPDLAGNIFDLVEKFAGYGFNKSHSAAYALLSYQTAWLKCHHKEAFMSAVMSADMDNTDKVVILIDDCNENDITVLPPDINASEIRFSVDENMCIRYGLGAIKGVGGSALNGILEERRNNGPFTGLDDLCRRVDTGKVNRRVLESLIKAGAFDSLHSNRASLFEHLPEALKAAEQVQRDRKAGQNDLFGLFDEPADGAGEDAVVVPYPDVPEWPDGIKLGYEKDTLGLFLTGHPIEEYVPELKKFVHGRISELCGKVDTSASGGGGDGRRFRSKDIPVLLAGLNIAFRTKPTKRGKMGFVTLDDRSARVEAVIGPELFEQKAHLLQKDRPVIVEGDLGPDDFNGGFRVRVKDFYDMDTARARYARALKIRLQAGAPAVHNLDQLIALLDRYRDGSTPVVIDYNNGNAFARLRAGKGWKISPRHDLLTDLDKLAGQESVELVY
ncbi:DNA polymerase III subunit alpha [Granulosicoccaceae sp. 1_MG-2023]|nr:DNA polymerase III subunit alpha [Granulosicoccaceae sp. 1_MG-2023]